jgi:hypothetical protein
MSYLEPILDWVQLHYALVYFATAGLLLITLGVSLFFSFFSSSPDAIMCLPQLISDYDAGLLNRFNPEQLRLAQILTDFTIAELNRFKRHNEGHLALADEEMLRKLLLISPQLSQLTTVHYGIDGMTRLHHA